MTHHDITNPPPSSSSSSSTTNPTKTKTKSTKNDNDAAAVDKEETTEAETEKTAERRGALRADDFGDRVGDAFASVLIRDNSVTILRTLTVSALSKMIHSEQNNNK